MALSLNQVKERLKSPTRKTQINKAIRHENRLRFHVESFMEGSEVSQPLTVFLDWVKTLIPKDKFKIFVSLFQFPTPVVKLNNSIFNELERVFDGKNPSYTYQFIDPKYQEDWENYKTQLYKDNFWREKGWEAVRTSINSVLIVDLPKDQEGTAPEPYFYLLDIRNVIDYDYHPDKGIEAIIFKQPGNRIAVFDDESYRVFKLDDKGEIVDSAEDNVENPHDLGYCPAKFFWSDMLSTSYKDLRKSPISAQLADLDWLLFFSISKKHLDLYAPYPIYSTYESDCDFENNESGEYCDGGYLRNTKGNYKVMRDGTVEQCPVCADKKLAGVGSLIEIPAPQSKDDPDLRDPITITTIDKGSLDYNVGEVARLAKEVFTSVVGSGGEVQHKESINEMQVSANFESKTSILNSLKENFQKIIKFTDDTVCRLRYGDQYVDSSISMGTEFYIYSIEDLYKQFSDAKKNGASDAELDAISDQIIDTEYRNNPGQLQRMMILKHLEPYRHYTFNELMQLEGRTLLDKDLLQIKINFSTFVDRFERENTDIVEFGHKIEFNNKIQIITDKFKEYVKEFNTGQEPRPGSDD